MLSKEEETELEEIIECLQVTRKFRLKYDNEEVSNTIDWLANKLKETNDELGKVTEELYKANELSAKLSERYE